MQPMPTPTPPKMFATTEAVAGELQAPRVGFANLDNATGHQNMLQLIQLRWFAVVGQVVTILLVHYGFAIRLPLDHMLQVLTCLALFNMVSLWRSRSPRRVTNGELFLALLIDVATLTAQLYLSGGATNPFVFLFLLQVTLGAVLLKPWSTWTMVVVTSLCFALLALFSRPLALPLDHHRGLASPYVQGMLVCFALNAALLVIFITRISRNLRARDARLADLRQRASEEEHIVRMGLLASGAAHELGTPLATLAVILGDWRRHAALQLRPRAAHRGGRDGAADPALQEHRERHPAVGRRGARRVVRGDHRQHLPGRPGARSGAPPAPSRISSTTTALAGTCPWSPTRRSSR
jgi:two-component system sensor histidine kinase RegB